MDKVGSTERLEYYACRKMLKELALRTGITKKVNPHSFTHARASRLANTLTESQMKEYLGWTQDSGMASVYVHLSGRDIDSAILRLNGVTQEESSQEETALRLSKCARCEADNSPTNRFCSKCGGPLDLKTAMELQVEEEKTDEIMNKLLEDNEFKQLLVVKLRELSLKIPT